MKRVRTPQEKKLLSYSKDGRNTVAEARSKSRKAIAKRKAMANRALRHAESAAVAKIDQLGEDVEVTVARSGRKSWKKISDAPLGEYVARTLNRRAGRGMNPGTRSSALLKKGRKKAAVRDMAFKGPLQNDSDR